MLAAFAVVALLTSDLPPAGPSSDEAPALTDAQHLARFGGALLGGAVGLGAGLAVVAAANSGCTLTCSAGPSIAALLAMPLLSSLTAWLGHLAAGGEAGWGAAVLGLLPGAVLSLVVLAVLQAGGGSAASALVPMVGVSGVSAAGMAVALSLRDAQVGRARAARRPVDVPPWRTLGTVGITAVAYASSFALMALTASTGPVLPIAIAALTVLAAPAAAWGAHASLGGTGTYWAALGALALAGGLWAAVSVPVLLAGARGGSGFFYANAELALFLGGGGLLALAAPLIGLELSHAAEAAPVPSVSLTPLPGGGVYAGLGFRF